MSDRHSHEAGSAEGGRRSGGGGGGGAGAVGGAGEGAGGSGGFRYEAGSSAFSDALASTQAYFSPFLGSSSGNDGHAGMPEHNRLLAEVAPHIMRPRILSAAVAAGNTVSQNVSSSALVGFLPLSRPGSGGLSLSHPARSLIRLGNSLRQGPVTARDLHALESSYQILATAANEGEVEEPRGVAREVSLLRGFQATMPSSLEGRARRRKARGRDGPHLGLKAMSDSARGLLTNGGSSSSSTGAASEGASAAAVAAAAAAASSVPGADFEPREARKARRSAVSRKEVPLSQTELQAQKDEIVQETEDINIRRMLLNAEISEVEARMAALALVRDNLQKDLLDLQEEELELNDEFEGVSELLAVQRHRSKMPGNAGAKAAEAMAQPSGATGSSRRKKAALFLPSEHDELPPGVAFMTLANHTAPITSLDFSEPYGTLVSSALDDSVRVWDLSSGAEVGRLRGHSGTVKCLQVEDELCITGGVDSSVRLWDLHRVEDYEARLSIKATSESKAGGGIIKQGGESNGGGGDDDDDDEGGPSAKGNGTDDRDKEHDPCLRSLEGHSKAVTSLYFDDTCLVTGASDKTLRQWDLNTGQCVLTMDILWAISNPTSSQSLMPDPTPSSDEILGSPVRDRSSRSSLGGSSSVPGSRISSGAAPLMADKNFSGPFSYPTPAFADGSWEMYQDFVGGVQFWGYALASGSGDGAVRMWDMRTGQAHRTLHGHTGPVTSLQFDETHVVSASLDRSVRIWDLRTGAISETIRFDYPVTDVQFDSRKIVAATGENQVKIFNRTSLQTRTLATNGHTSPVEKVRYMDRYAVSGGKDHLVKVWAL
ncbi:WD40 repeat-like protein [Acaromyces ingoldii]|uniref:WD40 repeat-like protein n=1 Tax=Acaromyces ingoldii TaxID=215250 RepID=A0A316YL02_9BASI|nr:WD40 repeat-like protein [Acaromyces ingoldii]PWN89328.1 WD40 repeat-like protein [Acaromyces ingoldii]